VMARDPAALQLRLLQTVVEVAAEKNSTLVMPVPVELLRFFERYAPTPPQSAQPPPPPLEDTGEAELEAAEAAAEVGGAPPAPEIEEAPAPQIADAAVPELDEAAVPPPPEAGAAPNGAADTAAPASAPDGS
jgi:hypothetical protein